MSDTLDDKVDGILKEVGELPESFEVTDDQNLKFDLGIDSLAMIDVVMRMEAVLEVEISEKSVENIATVADLKRQVRELVGNPVSRSPAQP